MTTISEPTGTGAANHVSYLKGGGKFDGFLGWIFSTDHKRIGILYLITILTLFSLGVMFGVMMRLELIAPGKTLFSAAMYNALFTVHGIIMIFFFIIPGIPAIFGNFFLPLHLGANDVAFPRLNLLSWWIYLAGVITAILALTTGTAPPDTGWTFYAPYSLRTGTNVSLAVLAAFVLGFSSILTGLNFITTIHRLRVPGIRWFKLSLFSWSLYATSWVQVLVTPIVGITLLLVIFERVFGIGVFDPNKGGDPILYQHLFWIYSHPAVYIMILPAMGVISEIIPVFARRTIFGYKAIAYSSLTIASVGSLVWGHHMFVSGQSYTADVVFSFLTFIVAVPSAIKVFNWLATLYKGSIHLETPMLFSLSFIFLFSIGGLTGLMQGALLLNIHIHDTAFVVGHFHYVMFGGTGFAFFAALHYWFPKIFGRMYNRRVSVAGWLFMFVGFNVLYFPMLIMGWLGMPRRYFDYLPQFHPYHFISTVGSWILVAGMLIVLINLIRSIGRGAPVGPNPWGAATLEWTVPSPPATENFEIPPVPQRDPYDYKGLEMQ